MAHNTAATAPEQLPVAPPSGHPIDLVHLARQTLGDSGLQEEVLRLFDQLQHTYFSRLETSTNRNELMVNLHALKGAAAGVGAFALARLARTAEDELRAGAAVNPERVDDIGMAVEELSAYISSIVPEELEDY
jgi:HPt (histidine-containing phosphotransfer) domain-containing protein